MPTRTFLLLCLFVALPGVVFCQQSACKAVELPVGVISASGDVFRGLAAEDFVGHTQKKPVSVKALTYDDGPRRVLLVVDTNKKLSEDTRKAEVEMIQALAASVRPEDTLALMVARGPGRDVNFTADRSLISQAIRQDADGKRGKEAGVLDTIMTGIEWFGAPQAGDAIVVMAADLAAGNRKANAKQVAKALEEHHIRMFGLALGPVQTQSIVAEGTMTSTISQGLAYATPIVGEIVYNTGDEHFFPLTSNSGGVVLGAMNMDTQHSYSMNDAHLVQGLRQKARSLAKMISAFYRMQIEPPQSSHSERWSLEVNEEMRKHAQQMWVLYPRELGPCE